MSWYRFVNKEKALESREDLYRFMDIASASYARHTDWFIRHRDTSVRQLAVLIAAQLLIIKLTSDPNNNSWAPAIILIFLSFLSYILALTGSSSCQRSFIASLESVLFFNKCIWAIIPTGYINVLEDNAQEESVPARSDTTLQVPRFVQGASKFSTTEEYINYHIGKDLSLRKRSRNTYFWSCVTIWALGVMGIIIGVAGALTAFF